MANQAPIPSFFNPDNAANWNYRPSERDLFVAAQEYRKVNGIKVSMTDRLKVHFLGIDLQKDFCFPEGTLFVGGRSGTGAIDDSRRIAEFLYRNLSVISRTTMTMDSHFPFQIFFSSFWVDQDRQPVPPFTVISVNDVRFGKYQPNPAIAAWLSNGNYSWLRKQVEYYCNELERAGKYQLYLWPEHTMMGSDGYSLVGVIQEARMFQAYVRQIQAKIEVKGGNELTENYSVLGPEVTTRFDGKPLAQKNARFVRTLLDSDRVIIAGQAASHCVKSSIDDLLEDIQKQDPELARKVYVLVDCMSSVTIPDGQGGFIVDFTSQMDDSFQRYADSGMNLVKSTDLIEDWPGFGL